MAKADLLSVSCPYGHISDGRASDSNPAHTDPQSET